MDVKTRDGVHVPDDLLDALHTRSLCLGSPTYSREETTADHLDSIYAAAKAAGEYPDTERGRRALEAERELLDAGERYFAEGYRLRWGPKHQFGLTHDVPDDAVQWALVTAGYIAATEQYRLVYAARQRVKADSPQPDSPPVDPLFAVIYEAQEVPRDLKQKVKRAMERGLVPAREAHTMTGSEYNGWTNYQTWDAASYLMNTERDYNAIVGMAHGTRDAGVLARRLRSAYGFDRRTNWAEIAEYFLDEVADEA